ncbi:hypothetical protein OG21DRAFT_1504213 [Imleria badia]|nr:hypothetical protein OG21DRAFT_1504213 [Imleria badia]
MSTPLPDTITVSTPQATTTTKSVQSTTASSTSDAGTIAGCVVGGVVFLVLVVLAALLFLRARKRKRTPPSSEFINSIREGAPPVLRLDSGAEYSAEKTHYPPTGTQNTYYTSSPMLDMKFPVEIIDTPSARLSVEKPLHPQRYSAQHQPSTSVGSRRELLSDTGRVSSDLSPVRRSPHTDSVLHFAPRFSLDDPSQEPSQLSHSPPSLHPLRRQPDSEDT